MKNWKVRTILFGMVLCSAIIIGHQNTAKAASKADLVQKVQRLTKNPIKKVFYADYDSDGSKEAFIVAKQAEDQQTLWFASTKQTKKLETALLFSSKANGICKVTNKQKLFVIEGSAGGSGSWSYCYYVKNGKVYMVKRAGEQLTHISGRNFAIYPSEFDSNYDSEGNWTGHTWKAYYVYWTGTLFKQYTGKEISKSKVNSYKNGKKYFNQIKKTGYKIGKIYYRKNGIININLYKKDKKMGFINYNNVTLYVKGNKVVLQVHYSKGKNIIEKSGYGGVYKSTCNIVKAVSL